MLNEVSDELQHGTKPPQVYQFTFLGLNQIMPMTRDGNPSGLLAPIEEARMSPIPHRFHARAGKRSRKCEIWNLVRMALAKVCYLIDLPFVFEEKDFKQLGKLA